MSTATLKSDVSVFQKVDFNWVVILRDIWRNLLHDVPEIHASTRRDFSDKLAEMRHNEERGDCTSPLGWIINGHGGSGKTHLLGAMRREAVRQHAAFVLVDMTDIRNFWDTVLQGYLDSLQEQYRDDMFQHQFLLKRVIARLGPKHELSAAMQELAQRKTHEVSSDVQLLLARTKNRR